MRDGYTYLMLAHVWSFVLEALSESCLEDQPWVEGLLPAGAEGVEGSLHHTDQMELVLIRPVDEALEDVDLARLLIYDGMADLPS